MRWTAILFLLAACASTPTRTMGTAMSGAEFERQVTGQVLSFRLPGPGGLDERIANARLLPTETITYVERVTARVEGGRGALVRFTRPDGSAVFVDGAAVRGVRKALSDEYAPGVQTVITVGAVQQGVIEPIGRVRAAIAARGGSVTTRNRVVKRLVLSCARDDFRARSADIRSIHVMEMLRGAPFGARRSEAILGKERRLPATPQ